MRASMCAVPLLLPPFPWPWTRCLLPRGCRFRFGASFGFFFSCVAGPNSHHPFAFSILYSCILLHARSTDAPFLFLSLLLLRILPSTGCRLSRNNIAAVVREGKSSEWQSIWNGTV